MNALDWILLAIRWGHAVSAVAWVGGGVFYLMVLRPAIRQTRGLPADTGRAIGVEFRGLVSTAIAGGLLSPLGIGVAADAFGLRPAMAALALAPLAFLILPQLIK